MTRTEALVLDFGNVLVQIDFHRAFAAWAAAAGVPPRRLAEHFAFDAAYCAHECGAIDHRAYFAHLRQQLGIEIGDEAFLEGWNTIIGEPMPEVEAVVEQLAARFPLYVFSNTNPAHIEHFTPRYRELLGCFRKTITSCDLGRRKPEPEAFARLSSVIGVSPARLAFFDDVEENVAGARRAGLQAFRVARPAEILAISESLTPAHTAG